MKKQNADPVAHDRPEDQPCEEDTEGCCIDHTNNDGMRCCVTEWEY